MKFLYIFIALMFIGCGEKVIEVPKEVYVPVKCKVERPTPPYDTGDPVLNNTNILIYTEVLKTDLDFCVDGSGAIK